LQNYLSFIIIIIIIIIIYTHVRNTISDFPKKLFHVLAMNRHPEGDTSTE